MLKKKTGCKEFRFCKQFPGLHPAKTQMGIHGTDD